MGGNEIAYIVVFCTVPKGKGEELADILVKEKVAACVNVVKGLRSFYWWKGNIERDDEELLIIKTSTEKFETLEKTIKENHPYTVPEIIALPIIAGNPDYLNWIDESIK
ncbi:MAG: divalent-cation tolerance protein CutA [candidate division WOR-3 bacterium]